MAKIFFHAFTTHMYLVIGIRVIKEIKIANELGKKVIQIIGYKDGDYKRVEGGGTLYSWNWPNLKKLLA